MVSYFRNKDDCGPCKRERMALKPKEPLSVFAMLLLVLLPKCPFCFLAYSSTAMLCGRSSILTVSYTRIFSSSSTVYFTAFCCGLILLSIFLKYRDARTKYALGLAGLGSALLLLSVTAGGGLLLYYSGLLMVFAGIWLNGSLLFVIGRVRDQLFKSVLRQQ